MRSFTPTQLAIINSSGFKPSWLFELQFPNITDGLIGYWPMDESSGITAPDESSNSNDGTLTGTTPTWGIGKVRNAFSTPGVDEFVNCGNAAPLDDIGDGSFSVAFWVKAGATINWGEMIFSKYEDVDNCIYISNFLGFNRLRVKLRKSGNEKTYIWTDITPFDKSWHHIVVVVDRTEELVKIWMDGMQSSFTLDTSGMAADMSNTGNVAWGAAATGTSYFCGDVDEGRIYNKVLTQTEIDLLYGQWSTKEKTFDGIDYTFKIIPKSFNGVKLSRSKSEIGVHSTDTLSFSIENKDYANTMGQFTDAQVLCKFIGSDGTDEEILRQWIFTVKTVDPSYQTLSITCVEPIREFLNSLYPAEQLIESLFPVANQLASSDTCVPKIFGTSYIPLGSVYISGATVATGSTIAATGATLGVDSMFTDSGAGIGGFERQRLITSSGFSLTTWNNITTRVLSASPATLELDRASGIVDEAAGNVITLSQGSRFFVLGASVATYTPTKICTPKELGMKEEWESGSYTFEQSNRTDPNGNVWKCLRAFIFDMDADGTADAPGIWGDGSAYLDAPVKFSSSLSTALTSPNKAIQSVLEDIGIDTSLIDTAATFASAADIYTSWGLTFNGGFWEKRRVEEVLTSMLTQCNSKLTLTNKIELSVLNASSVATLNSGDVLRKAKKGAGTFRYQNLDVDSPSDSGEIGWMETDNPQDRFIKTIVPIDATVAKPSGEVFTIDLVQDSRDVQKIGVLHYQRRLAKEANVSFSTNPSKLNLEPDDVISVTGAIYGGDYEILIDNMYIRPNGSIDFNCIRFSIDLDNWEDLNPGAITPVWDDTEASLVAQPALGAPPTDGDMASSGFSVWGRPFVVVGPSKNVGDFTDIQDAMNHLTRSRYEGIYILNGEYSVPPLYLPNMNLQITGESRGGVVLKNHAGQSLFLLDTLTKIVGFSNFTIESLNDAGSGDSRLIWSYRSDVSYNTSKLLIDKLDFLLSATESDNAIYDTRRVAELSIKFCDFTNGSRCVYSERSNKAVFGGCNSYSTISGVRFAEGSGVLQIYDNIFNALGNLGIRTQNDEAVIMNNRVKVVDPITNMFGISVGASNGVVSNNQVIIEGAASSYTVEGIRLWGSWNYQYPNNNAFVGNVITIELGSGTGKVYGFRCSGVGPGINNSFNGNTVRIDLDDPTDYHYGFYSDDYFTESVINGFNIDMVNTGLKDTGIMLDTGCDNNSGSANNVLNAGVSINDLGANNSVVII